MDEYGTFKDIPMLSEEFLNFPYSIYSSTAEWQILYIYYFMNITIKIHLYELYNHILAF